MLRTELLRNDYRLISVNTAKVEKQEYAKHCQNATYGTMYVVYPFSAMNTCKMVCTF